MHTNTGPHSPPRQPLPRRFGRVLLALLALGLLVLVLGAEYILHNAEPVLRRRIVETLAARFKAPVTLETLHISLFRGVEVAGDGLAIGYSAAAVPVSPGQPMIAVQHFRFRTNLLSLLRESLLRQPTHVNFARVEGLTLHIPPPHGRDARPAEQNPPQPESIALIIDQFACRDVHLFLEAAPSAPGPHGDGHKSPLEFYISTLDLQSVGRHQAMRYDAQLLNPKPVGTLHVFGHFGPWAADVPGGQPGTTPIDGDYTLDHADLATIKGIAGTLSSTGHFKGVLDRLVIDGHTDTPNFSLDTARHSLPLHTDFHAIVDGTNGDTYLQPVRAWLGGSAFTTTGKVVKVIGSGHDIDLEVNIPHGRMGDFLRLAVKTEPPLLDGTLALHAQLQIPPGNSPVPERLALIGHFTLTGVRFSNARWQSRIDGLSARAEGHPELAKPGAMDRTAEADSRLDANVTLAHGILSIADLHFTVPGAQVLMNGVYSADGKLFEFKGKVRTEATASQMVGGWKGLLLSPFDHYLQKNGAGVELPVEISGTQGDLHLGLATAGVDDPPARLLTDLRDKAHAQQELAQGRDLFTEARAEDEAAARAPSLAEAQRHHDNAVRLRAEAQHLAQAANGSR